ncbi:MAG TPA: glycosyltransferase family 4 protein [Micromonosporaceae bacterium]|nr:glycosyltransferase family 4 protein [Micromonosporaceae bacterium]
MKVVIAHNRYSSTQPSGENVMVDAEIAQLRAAGVEVVPFIRSSDEIGSLPLTGKLTLPMSPVWAPGAQRDLTALLREHRPDVFHLHNPYPLLSPWVVRTAHAHGLPVVQTVHNYRHVCAAATFLRDGAVCRDCVGRRFAVPAVVHRCYRGSRAQSVVMAGTLAAHRGTWRSVDRFVALTGGVADFLREYGIPEDRITVRPNAVDDPGPAPEVPGDGFLYLGRLAPEKGIGLLLDAWRRHPEGNLGTLRIAGDGPLRSAVVEAAAARTDIEHLGLLDRPAVREAIRAAAAVVTPSTWHDVLPTVILEALANGRPVLGTALGGIPYLIGEGTPAPAGWVVAPTVDALAAALPAARDGAAGLSAVARARYLATFTPQIVLGELIGVYERLAGARSR